VFCRVIGFDLLRLVIDYLVIGYYLVIVSWLLVINLNVTLPIPMPTPITHRSSDHLII